MLDFVWARESVSQFPLNLDLLAVWNLTPINLKLLCDWLVLWARLFEIGLVGFHRVKSVLIPARSRSPYDKSCISPSIIIITSVYHHSLTMSRGRTPGSFYSSSSRSSTSFSSSSPDTPRQSHPYSSRDSETLKSILEKITSLQSSQQVVLERLDENEARFQEMQEKIVNPVRLHDQPSGKEQVKPGRRSRRTPAALQVSSLHFGFIFRLVLY